MSTHPATVAPAGLPSGLAHIAHDRWDPIKESYDFTEHVSEHRVRSQVAMPLPMPTMAYTNEDIPLSHPTNRPILACTGLPRAFRVGSRCVNPLEPRYILPGTCSPSGWNGDALSSPGGVGGVSSPKIATVNSGPPGLLGPESSSAALPSPSRNGGERLLAPALSVPRSADAPRLQPLSSPSGGGGPQGPGIGSAQANACGSANPSININGAVGGLLLYGPTAAAPTAATAAAATAGDRCLDVSDINGQRRSSSVPPRRGGFDTLNVTDIVPPRKASPARPLGCLTTTDIRGATVRARTREVPSPGRGTLTASDISGAAPGCLQRASPTTYALGRWPAPSVPTYHFAHSTRVTLLKKPLAIGARQGES